jgi:alkylation response protein AidB-like acyl-CoA dehydrogenase
VNIILDRPGVTDAERELRANLVARAAELVPVLQANANRTEDERRIAEENITAIEDAGLFTIMQPRRYGGLETDFRTKLEVTRELARGCGSTAWTTSLINVCDEVWKDNPGNRIAGVLAPTGTAEPADGGYRVTGRWEWCTGCLHAQWALLGIPITGDNGQLSDQGFILVPMAELTIEDTWFVTGMKGTGSNTVIADNVFVPAHRYVSAFRLLSGSNDNPHTGEALYRAPFMPGGTIILAGPHLGLARAALDLVIEKAASRGIAYTFYDVQKNAPAVQLAVAKAASLADTAELLAYRAAAEVDQAGRQNEFPGYLARAKTRMDTVQAIVNAREAIRELVSAHGASAFAETNPLQRIWRDSEVASRHAIANAGIGAEVYGRALLGFTDGVTPLI